MELIYFSYELWFLSHWISFSYVVPFYHMCLEYSMILLFRILPLLESLLLFKKFPYISLQTLMTNSSILLTVCQVIFNIFTNAIMSCVCIINWHHPKFVILCHLFLLYFYFSASSLCSEICVIYADIYHR